MLDKKPFILEGGMFLWRNDDRAADKQDHHYNFTKVTSECINLWEVADFNSQAIYQLNITCLEWSIWGLLVREVSTKVMIGVHSDLGKVDGDEARADVSTQF